MAHLNYEEGKKVVFRGFVLLGIVTLLEVMVALVGKGYIIEGFHLPRFIMYSLMIGMSLYKAYFIIYEFMHMRYEVPGLVRSVLMPTMLLIWAIIAFFYEGNTWYHWRNNINDRPILELTGGVTKQVEKHPSSGTHDASEMHQEAPAAEPKDSNAIEKHH